MTARTRIRRFRLCKATGAFSASVHPVPPLSVHPPSSMWQYRAAFACLLDSISSLRVDVSSRHSRTTPPQMLTAVDRAVCRYVEYKARYCKKRGGHLGYGHFWLGSLSTQRCVFPLARPTKGGSGLEHEVIRPAQLQSHALRRVEITARLYQSFRGRFPTKL
jgi:hypothetical protein